MDATQGNETAGGVPGGQTPAPEVAGQTGNPDGGASASAPWKVRIGDTEYTETDLKTRLIDDHKRIHGEFTRSRQELSQLRAQSQAGQELLDLVRSDPQLLMEVRRRIAAGQSPQQAMQGAAANDPRLEKVDHVDQRLDAIEQERASEAFDREHPDLDEAGKQWLADWIEERQDKLRGANWSYKEILDTAYAHYFSAVKAKDLVSQGQRLKEQEIVKGKQAKSLGTVSPTSQAAPKKKGPTIHMKPSERLESAMDVFQRNAKKG